MGKWQCLKCGWEGDYPNIAHPEYLDGGYECCPNGCLDDEGEPEGVVLNFKHPKNKKWYISTLKTIWGGT